MVTSQRHDAAACVAAHAGSVDHRHKRIDHKYTDLNTPCSHSRICPDTYGQDATRLFLRRSRAAQDLSPYTPVAGCVGEENNA